MSNKDTRVGFVSKTISKLLMKSGVDSKQKRMPTSPPADAVITSLEGERLKKTVCLSKAGHKNPTPELYTYGGIKLGWVQGVLIPCLLNIWGVMLFLRISWIVAQAGIGLTLVIVFLSGVVCTITTLSLSAICTNGDLEGGGVYYLVSRSLGAELGASVGIIFAFANAVAASMNTIGFCDSLNELLRSHGVKIIDNGNDDTRIVGAIVLLVMCFICAVGMDWETKTQNLLIIIIVLAIANYIIGASMGPQTNEQIAQGFVGISLETAQANWGMDYREFEGVQYNFFSVFAMYFPAVTGVQAGANICGDLKNPAHAIPLGTFLAVFISLTSYLTMAVLAGMGALRDASGDTSATNHTILQNCKPDCDYGLHNNYEIMQLMSLWPPLIYAGCWAATLSTALTNLLSVPRLIQALGVDQIYPGLVFFSKRYGKHGEPYRGYVLTYFVSLAFVLIADLNMIAPLISNFYLASYALINFCSFHAGLVRSISWRPTFPVYKWVSLMGFLLCLGIMIVISWVMALVTTFIFITLYLLVVYTKPEASWGSSTETQRYHETVTTILQISRRVESIKSYNPQVLVMAGMPYSRPVLLDVGHLITKVGSFMIVADIEHVELSRQDRDGRIRLGEDWILSRKNRAFFIHLNGLDMESGMRALAQSAGLGRLSPNIMLIGFKSRWRRCPRDEIARYVRIIQHAFNERLAVAILRAPVTARPIIGARQYGRMTPSPSSTLTRPSKDAMHKRMLNLMHADSQLSLEDQIYAEQTVDAGVSTIPHTKSDPSVDSIDVRQTMLKAYQALSFDQDKPIDAWWLYDDGGMNILLPYIIARRGFKEKRSFRIFALTKSGHTTENAKTYMENVLKKFRIEYNVLKIVKGIADAPADESWDLFNKIAKNFKTDEAISDVLITDSELTNQHLKTCRYLRLRELLLQNSSVASFIVISLPMPRRGHISACLYMTWLEVISLNMPPVLFVRGNDTTVLDI